MSDPNADAYDANTPQSLDVNALDGDARAAIEVMLGLERAPCGEHKFIIKKSQIHGNGDPDGIEDAQGRNWHLEISCPSCDDALPRNKWSTLL